ncbi:hemerythrin domain-containing protein [Paucibacter sp. APW11]|uniref:Hemerythrin domain-containing protein n=1 Tax=Roseateles aquae TaxID=3077235 RepID=A0ABU3P783_9BURK|nr:hemerythrin domain-containing protein [Paucibacter sp. APW11]MDT8998434.1 hemerythrin domain-containing protein [Paucibacter sp. APW11]
MSSLAWSDQLALNQPQIDSTHQEFVELLQRFRDTLASGADPLPALRELIAHTEEHFAMEERWMAATGFAPENCHSKQHSMVLDTLREVLRYAVELKDSEPMQIIGGELAQWFPAHAEMMDAALVFHMQQVGFDPATGTLREPLAAESASISSCGSSSCG